MSTPLGRVSPTRQQLDELDNLLQRLLALPGHALEAETTPAPVGPPPPVVPVAPPAPPRLYTVDLTPALPPPPLPANTPVQIDSGRLTIEQLAPLPGRVVPAVPTPTSPPPTPAPEVTEPLEPPTPWPLWPLLAFDWVIVNLFRWLGPPGRWLVGPTGKRLLAFAGVLMLGGAIAWGVADYCEWEW